VKICWRGYLGSNHSWSIVAQNISRSLIKKGHEVHLCSTNGLEYFPEDLKPYLRDLDKKYDMQLTYTAMRNFQEYLSQGSENRFAIWNYETTVLPHGFAKNYKFTDKMLPSSEFSKTIFAKAGIPEESMVVIPHGVDLEKFERTEPFKLKTHKRYKILANIAQPHIRKNIPGLLEAFGKAFTKNDDVCLVLKIVNKKPTQQFDVSFNEIYASFKARYKNHAEIELLTSFIPDIESLYNACDIVMTMSHAECFWMVGLEGFAANKIVIAPNYGGQLDYMNDDNSILIDGKVIKADAKMQYWTQSPYAAVFSPSTDHCAAQLKKAVDNYDSLIEKFKPNMKKVIACHTWDIVADKIVNLCTNNSSK